MAILTPLSSQVERGVITKGAEVEIVGLGESFKTTLTGIGERNDLNLVPRTQLTCVHPLRNAPQGARQSQFLIRPQFRTEY